MKIENRDPNAVTDYIYMYSGTKVELEGNGSPTIHDIAVHCGRIPRFAGATRGWWSVLHHLLCAEMVAEGYANNSSIFSDRREHARLRLGAIMHDAHEALTGDIPSPFKSPHMREFQKELDLRIYDMLGVHPLLLIEQEKVHEIDRALLAKEGEILGPPGDDWYVSVAEENPEMAKLAEKAINWARSVYGRPKNTIDPNGPAVKDFTQKVPKLVNIIND